MVKTACGTNRYLSAADWGITSFYVSCEQEDVAEALLKEKGITGFYFPFDTMKKYFSPKLAAERELYLSTPHIQRGEIPEKWMQEAKNG